MFIYKNVFFIKLNNLLKVILCNYYIIKVMRLLNRLEFDGVGINYLYIKRNKNNYEILLPSLISELSL